MCASQGHQRQVLQSNWRGQHTWIILLRAILGVSSVWRNLTPVLGHVRFPLWIHFSMQGRSYDWPVATMTGSRMMSMLMGQQKSGGMAGLHCWSGYVENAACSGLSGLSDSSRLGLAVLRSWC